MVIESTILQFVQAYFGRILRFGFVPSFFPFTEPWLEVVCGFHEKK